MRILPLFVLLAVLPGCTSLALKQATLSHAGSSTDLRYREVVENLAMSAANPDILPAYSSIYSGTTDINDNIRATSVSVWARTALEHPLRFTSFFSQQTADFLGSRAVKSNWTLDPTVAPEKLRAMRAACRWVTQGFANVGPDVKYLMAYQPAEYCVFDVQLLPGLKNVNEIPKEGERLILVADVSGTLYCRIFGIKGTKSPLFNLKGLDKKTIKNLEAKLQGLWHHKLTGNQKGLVATSMISIVNTYFPQFAKFTMLNDPEGKLTLCQWPSENGYYFDVADRLAQLPTGWLHRECRWRDVPLDACYWAGSGEHFVWVGPEGMDALSKFVLILQKIARTQLPSACYPRTQTRTIQKNFSFEEDGKEYIATATIYLDEKGILTTGENKPAIPLKQRIDNVGQNSDLKSVINAAAKSSTP